MTLLRELSEGKRIVYIATRLFDFSEKIKAEDLERAVLTGIRAALKDRGMRLADGTTMTFVPFRDTIQNVTDRPIAKIRNLNKAIFEEDISNLSKSVALVAHFDGLSKDEGIGIEIGFAYGRQIPTLLAVTDFVRLDFKGDTPAEHLLDPVIEFMATSVLYRHEIPEGELTYRGRLVSALEVLYSDVVREMKSICLNLPEHLVGRDEHKSSRKKQICIDFGGGQFEWQSVLAAQVSKMLELRGYHCVVSDRYSIDKFQVGKKIGTRALGESDVRKLENSEMLISCSDMLEMSSGTAALQGYARALGKAILLYDSKTTYMVGDNTYRSSRNLMVDNSADEVVSALNDIPKRVEELFGREPRP